jgi:uncharacterized spore protein YtfJ
METVETLMKSTFVEVERILSTKSVVGEPMMLDGHTVVPLVSVGFGIGGGGGTGRGPAEKGEGSGLGVGAGGGVKPVAVIVRTNGELRVEPIRGVAAGVVERAVDAVARIAEKRSESKLESKLESKTA